MGADAASPAALIADGIPSKPKQFRAPTTWHQKTIWERTFAENLNSIDLGPAEIYEKTPGVERGDPPQHPILLENCFCLFWSFLPILAQDVSYRMYPGVWRSMTARPFPFPYAAATYMDVSNHWSLIGPV